MWNGVEIFTVNTMCQIMHQMKQKIIEVNGGKERKKEVKKGKDGWKLLSRNCSLRKKKKKSLLDQLKYSQVVL